MARTNPQVETLEREVALLRRIIARVQQDPPDIPFAGCGDNSCITTQGLGGMATNGGCRCNERQLRHAVRYWRDVAIRRQAIIQAMLRGEWSDGRCSDSVKSEEASELDASTIEACARALDADDVVTMLTERGAAGRRLRQLMRRATDGNK